MRKTVLALTLCSAAVMADPAFIATQHGNLKIDTVATDLAHPWGISVLPDGQLLVTERDGRLRYIDKSGKVSAPISGLPEIVVAGQGGLLDVLLDKDFASNQLIYLSYAEPGADNTNSTAVAKARLDGQSLKDFKVIFSQTPKFDSKYHFGGRLVQQADGNLFVTTGDRGSQRLTEPCATTSARPAYGAVRNRGWPAGSGAAIRNPNAALQTSGVAVPRRGLGATARSVCWHLAARCGAVPAQGRAGSGQKRG